MTIEVNIDSRKCWSLKIDGKEMCGFFQHHKLWIKMYLLKMHGIDLLTDPTIKRNYIEYSIKKVTAKNNKIYLVKEKRQLIFKR